MQWWDWRRQNDHGLGRDSIYTTTWIPRPTLHRVEATSATCSSCHGLAGLANPIVAPMTKK